MANTQEKFKTVIGGQALIEGIMMRGPDKDAVVVRKNGELHVEVSPRKKARKGSVKTWPLIRGAVGFIDAQITGVKALMRSADLSPEMEEEQELSKFDRWLEKKLGDDKFQKYLIGGAVALGLGMSVLLFFLLPGIIGGLISPLIPNTLFLNLVEGLIRIAIFFGYMLLVSRMSEMKRVFAYHGAEHKTIRCYEAGLPLTVENVRMQTRKHPRCGTSFLFVVLILSILVFSATSSLVLMVIPNLEMILGSLLYRVVMILLKLLLLPLVVAISYEINRLVGRYDNFLTRILTAPGMWFQNFTTNEPDDSMIQVGIAALEAVLPEEAGTDRW
ncbi:MAG: DUF1385 domain-containing protein [Oscillospiraceae bacterium]|nr:DUF1385 domain-containing protein [Oscillospiraceae bacterium]